MKESVFQVRVQKLRRIAILRQICDALGMHGQTWLETVIWLERFWMLLGQVPSDVILQS